MNKAYQHIELEQVDSTSRFLKDYVVKHQPTQPIFCTTQNQTNGYGQQKRVWVTNEHSAIFSLAYPLPANTLITGLFSLQFAKLIHQTLALCSDSFLYLKWPNDIYNEQGKVAGMLIEQVVKNKSRTLVIGVGINRHPHVDIDGSSAVDYFDLNAFLDALFERIAEVDLTQFSADSLIKYWNQHDYFKQGEAIQLICAKNKQRGHYLGINQHGQALIKLNAETVALSSGVESIRKLT